MGWVRLTDAGEELWRGTVFRLPGAWPYEELVDFMLIEDATAGSGFALLVATGHKAGLLVGPLPAAARVGDPAVHAISASWLRANWSSHVYGGADPAEVRLIDNAPPPQPAPT